MTDLEVVDRASLAAFIRDQADAVPVLGLAVGHNREKLKNVLRHHLGSSGWITMAQERQDDVIALLDNTNDEVSLVGEKRGSHYDIGAVLIPRAGTPRTATTAIQHGHRGEHQR